MFGNHKEIVTKQQQLWPLAVSKFITSGTIGQNNYFCHCIVDVMCPNFESTQQH